MSVRILLVDDHKILRTGLRSLLQSQQELEIVGEADNGREAVELTKLLSPDVVIMDVGMPDLNGFEATGQIVSEVPTAKVLALSMHSDKRFVRRMFQAGAMGYLLKNASFDDLIAAIHAVALNQVYLGPGIQEVVVNLTSAVR